MKRKILCTVITAMTLGLQVNAQFRLGTPPFADYNVEQKALKGNAAAQCQMGDFYLGQKDTVEAVKWYQMAADQNNPQGQNALGTIYLAQKDLETAQKWIQPAADAGYALAQSKMADICLLRNDIKSAKEWAQKAAAQQEPEAKWYTLPTIEEQMARMDKYQQWLEVWTTQKMQEYDPEYVRFLQSEMSDEERLARLTAMASENNAHAQSDLGDYYYWIIKDIEESIKWYQKAAENGFAHAQVSLGVYYLTLNDIEKGIIWLEKAASNGSPSGQFNLGNAYILQGKYIEAENNLLKAVEEQETLFYNDHLNIDIELFLLYYSLAMDDFKRFEDINNIPLPLPQTVEEKKSLITAARKCKQWLETGANLGNYSSAMVLGQLYELENNFAEAVKWFRKAIYLGAESPILLIKIANLLCTKLTTPETIKEGIFWYNIAIRNQNAIAAIELGELYTTGQYVPEDVDKAADLYEKAREWGNPYGTYNLGVLYLFETANDSTAFEYLEEAAQNDIPKALSLLGLMYQEGLGTEKDTEKANRLWQEAAQKNEPNAQLYLGYHSYLNGDIESAIEWLNKSISNNEQSGVSYYLLGMIYLVTQESYSKVVNYWGLSAEKGHLISMLNLGDIYAYAYKNRDLAEYWWKKVLETTQDSTSFLVQEVQTRLEHLTDIPKRPDIKPYVEREMNINNLIGNIKKNLNFEQPITSFSF